MQPWNQIIAYWKRSGMAIRPGVSMAQVKSFQAKYGVLLPDDLLEYFLAADGSSHDEMDDELFRFWPLSEMVPVHEYLADDRGVIYPYRFAFPDGFVFADYLIDSWMYAVTLTSDPMQSAPVYRVTGGEPAGEKMADSFRDFMLSYANDPSNIV